jgi:protein TonB
LTSDFTVRAAAVTASAVVHVLVYGALSLAPAWTPPPRSGLLITELLITEPVLPPTPAPAPVTPPRPRLRPKPQTAVATPPPPKLTKKAEPPIVEDAAAQPRVPAPVAPEPPAAAPMAAPPAAAVTETPREPTHASTTPAMHSDDNDRAGAVADGTLRASSAPAVTAAPRGGAAAVAALPSASRAGTPGPVSRVAIPRGGYQITPSYPASARRLGIEGTALLRVLVDSDGRVGDVVVKQSAGHPDLDRAAADAVRHWRFEPARRGADSVAMWVELPVDFRLR